MRKANEKNYNFDELESSPLELLQKSFKSVAENLVLADMSYLKTECRGMTSRLSDIIKSLNQQPQSLETKQ